MKLYMAPMEGITNHVYRQAHLHHFGQIDRYYMPFLSSTGLNYKEIRDIAPENNQGMNVIPQILTNHTDIFLGLATMLADLGYNEVNLNLGCPSGTVTAKGRGSGFLRFLPELDRFLEEIFTASPLPISVKTRIGYADEGEWPEILELLMKYPFTEMIIHPRLRMDLYRGAVRPGTYELAVERSAEERKSSDYLCYNGDINTTLDYQAMQARFPGTEKVMLGRYKQYGEFNLNFYTLDGWYESDRCLCDVCRQEYLEDVKTCLKDLGFIKNFTNFTHVCLFAVCGPKVRSYMYTVFFPGFYTGEFEA